MRAIVREVKIMSLFLDVSMYGNSAGKCQRTKVVRGWLGAGRKQSCSALLFHQKTLSHWLIRA